MTELSFLSELFL